MRISLNNPCSFSLKTCSLYLLGELFLAGQKFQQEKYVRWMEAMRLPKGFCTILNYLQDFKDALGLGFSQGKNLYNTGDRTQVRNTQKTLELGQKENTPPPKFWCHINTREILLWGIRNITQAGYQYLLLLLVQHYRSVHTIQKPNNPQEKIN